MSKLKSRSCRYFSFTGEDLTNLDNEQLISLIENLITEIKLLKVDNELNERFLHENDPELLNGIVAATLDAEKRKTKIQFAESVNENQSVAQTGNTSEISQNASFADSSLGLHSRPSRAASLGSSIGTFRGGRMNLSFVVKSDICEIESELEWTKLNVFEQNMRTQFGELLAEIEEIKLTTQDILYTTEMFKYFVIVKGKETNILLFSTKEQKCQQRIIIGPCS